MPYSPLQSIRRYQNISMFGGGIVVSILILIACVLGMGSIVYGYLDEERHNFLTGLVQTLNEIKVSETSFRNGVTNAQLIWRETGPASDDVVDAFYANGGQISIHPHPSVVLGMPGQTADRTEVARYLSLSTLLARICAASSINRGQTLAGYHYSTRTGLLGLVPDAGPAGAALATPQGRTQAMEALRIDFGDARAGTASGRPHVRWLPPFVDPVSGAERIRIAAQAQVDGEPFAVLVTEYAPERLLSWQLEHPSDGAFFITTAGNRLVTASHGIAKDGALIDRLLRLNLPRDHAALEEASFRDGFVIFHGRLDSTGWMLGYALRWTDVVANIALRAGLLLGASLLTIAIMWALLVRFHRRVFTSLYARSQRVFDSEALCRRVIETAPIGLGLISRADGHFMLVSPALAEMIARLGSDYRALSAQAIARYDTFLAGGASGGPMQVDLVLPDTDAGDASQHLEMSACGARYQEIDVLIVAIADVTVRRQLVQKLEEAVRAADSANAAKSSFLAAMTHEIRTPLNVILGNLELLENSALDASQHSRVQTLRMAASGLLGLVSDILDFSKIEAGAMSVESIEFDVIGVLTHELGAFAPIARAKGLSLFCEIGANDAQRMRGDPTRLAQVFGNLLSNAIKFTAHGHITARISVVSSAGGAAELVVDVEDTGIGIAAGDRHKLFKAFSQVDATITRRYGGTGLGLALSDRLVTAMGGRIEVTSAAGVGSVFTVRLPLGMNVAPVATQRLCDGVPLLVVAQKEWQRFAIPHLRAWGFVVDAHDRRSPLPAARHARAAVVILFGESDTWSRDELDDLYGDEPVVLATPDGPSKPYRAGRTIRVSSYALDGLRAALAEALTCRAVSAGAAPRPARAVAADRRRAVHVVLVDNEAVDGMIFREQLDVLGCAVHVAKSGRAALDVLVTGDWDVLVVAAEPPDMAVGVLASAVRNLGQNCEVVVVTSHLAPDNMRDYAAAGVGAVLTKPVMLAHLRGALPGAARRRSGNAIQDQDVVYVEQGNEA